MTLLRLSSLLSAMVLSACVNHSLEVGSDDSGSTESGSVANAFDAGGSCMPAGPGQDISSLAQAASAVAGTWKICSGLNNVLAFGAPEDTVGVEFAQGTEGGGYCVQQNFGSPCLGGIVYYLV